MRLATETEATIARVNSSMREFAAALSRALAPAMLAVKAACDQLGAVYLKAAETAYLEEHGALPGSIRTARLRKKRRDTVLRWFNRELASGRGARDLTHRSTTGET